MKLTRSQNKNNRSFKMNEMVRKEQQMQLDVTQKYNRFKKSASLPSYYINQARLNKITNIYRSLTTQKLRTHSTSKSQRQSHLHPPEKKTQQNHPFAQSSLNTFLARQGKPKQKLTLERGTENNPPEKSFKNQEYLRLLVKIKGYSLKLRDLLETNSEERFLQQFKVINDLIHHPRFQARESEQIRNCLIYMERCCQKREEYKVAEVKKKYSDFEKEFNDIQIELKKKTIKAMLTDKQILNYQAKVRETEEELTKLKSQISRKKTQIGVGTQFESLSTIKDPNMESDQKIFLPTQYYNLTNTNFYQNSQNKDNDHQCICSQLLEENSKKLEEYSKRIHSYNQRQKEMLSVMVVLQREGVDIQKIYSEVVNGKIEVQEEESQKIGKEANEVRKEQHQIYKKCRDIKLNSSADADNSIVSSEDGLSFNYEDKSLEEQAYTIRNEYKCQKDLGEEMKNRLKLNFNILYQDVDIYTGDFESGTSDNPTI